MGIESEIDPGSSKRGVSEEVLPLRFDEKEKKTRQESHEREVRQRREERTLRTAWNASWTTTVTGAAESRMTSFFRIDA